MKVLCTGSSGFIGSYLVNRLINDGHFVVGVDIQPARPEFEQSKYYEHVRIDLTRQSEVSRCHFNDCDYAFILSAKLGGIAYFHKYPYEMINYNEKILCNVFDMMLAMPKLSGFTYTSSSMVYESAINYPVEEDDLKTIPIPKSHYGFQKLAGELHSSAFSQKTQIPHTIIRPFNAVGANESLDRISSQGLTHCLPEFVYRALTSKYDEPMGILGDGQQIRSFTHGKDIARAMSLVMQNPLARNEAFNISSPTPTKMIDLAQMVWKRVHNKGTHIIHWPSYEHDVKIRIPNVDKAKQILGFEAKISLEETIDEVIGHVRAHLVSQGLPCKGKI